MAEFDKLNLVPQAIDYAKSRGIAVDFRDPFGDGTDGAVWPTSRGSALKLFYRHENYRDERDCYLRLQEYGVERVGKLYIPLLVDYDDRFWAVEMGVVKSPRLLDFGKVHIDAPPPYWDDPHVMAQFDADGLWLFRDHWPDVVTALEELRKLGIYYVDPKPGNITFGDETEDPNWDQEPRIDYSEYEE